jgi:hypothetical protein
MIETEKTNKYQKPSLLKLSTAIICAVMLFLLLQPYFVWNFSSLYFATPLIILIIIYSRINLKNTISLILFSFLYLYIGIMNELNYFGIIYFICIVLLATGCDSYIDLVMKLLIKIFAILLVPSIILYILNMFFGIYLPTNIIDPPLEIRQYNYITQIFLVTENKPSFILLQRFYGYFDEPGVIGTFASVFLIMQKMNLNKWYNKVILVGGILSFSLAFYLSVIVYILIYSSTKNRILTSIVIIFIISNELFYDTMSFYIYDRIQIEDWKLAGDNRVQGENFNIWFQGYAISSESIFGLGAKATDIYNYGGASYKDLIVAYGWILFLLYNAYFIVLAKIKLKYINDTSIFILVLLIIMYQRPFVTNIMYVFILFGVISYLHSNSVADIKLKINTTNR